MIDGLDNYDSLDNYMSHVHFFKDGVGVEREKQLSKIIKHSNNIESKNKAINELVNGNLGLVVKCAKDLHLNFRTNLSLIDLITEGNFWLFYCARRFSYKRNAKFNTYAYPIIRWHMTTAIFANTLIHIPNNLLHYKIKYGDLKGKFKGNLTKDIVMEELMIDSQRANSVNAAFEISVASLDEYIEGRNTETLNDRIKDESAPNPAFETDRRILKEYIAKLSDRCLTNNEKKVIALMFLGEDYVDSESLAKQMNISNQRVRQIRDVAIRKLKSKFFNDWDVRHKKDRVDKEGLYKETTGHKGYSDAYFARERLSPDFIKKLNKIEKEKSKKILTNMI